MFFINHSEIIEGKAVIIQVEGPLNSETSSGFEEYINKLLENGIKSIILDASGLSFISSEGIGVMLLTQRMISEQNGALVLFGLSSEAETLFRLLGFLELFRVSSDRAEALRILDRGLELKNQPPPLSSKGNESQPQHISSEKKPGPEKISPLFIDETVEPLTPGRTEKHFEPFVIQCVNCSSLIKIREMGPHICPECSEEFEVTGPGSAVFS